MKFTNYLVHITGITIYPLLSLMLFVVFFVAVTVWAFGADSRLIQHMENLPLD